MSKKTSVRDGEIDTNSGNRPISVEDGDVAVSKLGALRVHRVNREAMMRQLLSEESHERRESSDK